MQSRTARRALAARRRRGEVVTSAAARPRSASTAWPSKITHEDLDALAARNRVTFPEGTTTKADKQAALDAAGVKPEA